MPSKAGSVWFTILLGLLLGLTPLGTDSFLPAMPAIAQGFGAPVASVQLAVTTFFLGVAVGQLAWGPLSDRYGRRPVLLAGLVLFFVASLACASAGSVGEVAAGRLAQGLGMSSGPVIARGVVRDLYSRERAARMLARMMVVFGAVPIAAPLLGAAMLAAQGWRAIFWLLAATALALGAWTTRGLAETAPSERVPVHPGRVAGNFLRLLRDRRFVAPVFTMLCAQVGIYAFVSNSAFVLVHGKGLSATAYGACFAAVMLGQIVGAQLSSRRVLTRGIHAMLRTGTALACVSGLLLAALAWRGATHWSAVILPMVVYMFATSYILPHATAAALSPFPQFAGAASSLMGACQFSFGAAVSAGLGAAFDGTARPMATLIAAGGACSLAAYLGLLREPGALHGQR